MFCNEVSSAGMLRTTGVAGYPRCRPGAVCPSSSTTMSGKSGYLLCDVVHLLINIAILPGRAVRRGLVADPHCSDAGLERDAKCSIIVANEIFRCTVPGKRF